MKLDKEDYLFFSWKQWCSNRFPDTNYSQHLWSASWTVTCKYNLYGNHHC